MPERRLRRRRTRLTREGRFFIAIAVGIGLAAINTGNNLLYLLLGWLLSVIVASGVLSAATLRGLRVSRRAPPRLHANRPFSMELEVENGKRARASYSVVIEDLCAGQPVDKSCYLLKIPAGKRQRAAYRHTFSRRGAYKLDGFRIATRFPFSLFEKSRVVAAETELLVYPEVRPVPVPAPRGRRLGEVATERRGRHGDFFGLREYREGDDRRAIHWRSTARSRRLLVRELEDESQRRVTLLVDNALADTGDPFADEALEAAVALAASLATSYAGARYAVRLVARGALVPFGAGEQHLCRVLEALALLPAVEPETPFSAALEPHGESVLVAPRGSAAADRPAASHVMEAG